MNDQLKQREQSVRTSKWALEAFERIRPFLSEEDRDYIRDVLLSDIGKPQALRPPGKPRGRAATRDGEEA